MCLVEGDCDRGREAERDDGSGQQLDEKDRIDFPDECESDLGITVDDIDTDLEIFGKIIIGRLIHPRVSA